MEGRSMVALAQQLPRRIRRVVAVATMLGLPGSYAWYATWSASTAPKAVWGLFSFVFLLVSVVGALVLYTYAGNRVSGKHLDERQRQLRDRAWVLSYSVLSIAVAAAVVGASIVVLGFDRTIVLDGRVMSGVTTCFGVLVPVLPFASFAWLEPEPPAED